MKTAIICHKGSGEHFLANLDASGDVVALSIALPTYEARDNDSGEIDWTAFEGADMEPWDDDIEEDGETRPEQWRAERITVVHVFDEREEEEAGGEEVDYADYRESETSQRDRLAELWDTLDTPILRVMDEEGVNRDDAVVRHLFGDTWVYADEVDGFKLLRDSDLDQLAPGYLVEADREASE